MTPTNSPDPELDRALFIRSALDDYGRALHGYLLRVLRNSDEAGEVWQETFAELCRIKHVDLVRDPQSYVYKIAWRVLRRRKLRAEQSPVSFDSSTTEKQLESVTPPSNDSVADEVALESDLEAAYSQLSPVQQSVLVLALFRRMSDSEIAAELGLSEHTVRKYLKIAKAQLRKSCAGGEKKDQPR